MGKCRWMFTRSGNGLLHKLICKYSAERTAPALSKSRYVVVVEGEMMREAMGGASGMGAGSLLLVVNGYVGI